MLDQRGLKSLRNIATFMLLISIAINGILVLQYFGYIVNDILGITIRDYIRFFVFTLLIVSIGGLYNKAKNISQGTKDEMRFKMRLMVGGIAFFILYIVFAALIMKDLYFVIAGFIMLGIYINIIVLTEKIIVLGLNDRQRKWREAVYGTDYNAEGSSILWRFKLWFTPFERVPFNKRHLGVYDIVVSIILCSLLLDGQEIGLFEIIILAVIAIRSCFLIIEYILGLYTSLVGICTGIKEASDSENNKEYWTVYVTDFKNKREITYRTDRYPYISEGNETKVTHGIFSKRVILVNDRSIK